MGSTERKLILDLDGNMYKLKGEDGTFSTSDFGKDIYTKTIDLYIEVNDMERDQAVIEYEHVKQKYNDRGSIGFELEYGISRYDYFGNTWNLDPQKYIDKDPDLCAVLEPLRGRMALLTAGPRIWALRALSYLNVDDLFDDLIYTGEPDRRKPDPEIFLDIAKRMKTEPENIISIGDQDYSDIIPAKSLGMKAVYVGPGISTVADYQAGDLKLAITLLRGEGLL